MTNSQRQRADQLFTVLAYEYDHHLFLMADSSIGFGFLCRPMTGADASVSARVNVLLNQDWPPETLLQVSLWTSPDIEESLAIMQTRRLKQQKPTYKTMTQASIEFLRQGTTKPPEAISGARLRRSHILVTVKLPMAYPRPSEQDIRRASELQMATQQSLSTIGLYPELLGADQYVRILNTILNWQPDAGWKDRVVPECDPTQLIRDQLLDYDNALELDEKGLWLGHKRVKTLSAKRTPDHFYFGSAKSYLGDILSGTRGIRQNALLSLTLHYPDAESTRSKQEGVRQFITNQVNTPIAHFLPVLVQRKHHFDVLFDAYHDGDRPIRAYFGVLLFCDEAEEAAAVSNARVYFRELGFQLLEDKYFCLPFFLNCLPFGPERSAITDLKRYRTLATRHAIPLLPLFGDWAGTGTPTLNFVSRNGEHMAVSLFDTTGNYNLCIAAESGKGKSFLTNEIIVSYLTEGAQIWAIDVGRSYENLCEVLEGDFVKFTHGSGICMNPFEIVQNFEEEADMLAGLVSQMAAPTEKLTDFQTAGLKRILKQLWTEKAQSMSVDDIAKCLCTETDQRLKDVGEQLFPFTTRGEYGRYFNGKNNAKFTNDFTVLELEELKGRKHLQQVVLLQLIYQIQQEMYLGERNRPKIVIIDEAWDLLTEGDVAKFMEHGYRRFRKYGGAAVTITQSVNDLYRNAAGRAIVENSANMYLLGQKAEVIEGMKQDRRLPLSDGGYELLKTVHTLPGAYSEIFFITEMGSGIGRLIVDPYKRILFSTKPEDVNALKQLRRQGLSLGDAIQQLIDNRSSKPREITYGS
ncbi:type IV secretion system protein TraC [Methylomonas sp. LW13]|uniref:Type IV secretion system protein TraC n=2 Tax=Methylomonas TaxID=416 RepID=A0ABU4U912_9GAMM|nr:MULTISPECIES: type IV secretion system protein TraC [unclassified Methylomonas]MCQ8181021.1 type IV secretion system protein TraC [Methylomonas sp. SURF-1]MDX8125901.1 type IV secretion system protein TraC [Methylomonas sp. OY6]QBC26006.1 type IV secretion system protein TraC [Methylomonas sp. LW13]